MPRQKTPAPTEAPKRPHISVIERRLQNPLGMPSEPIHLREQGWTCRIFNSQTRADRIWLAKQLGWEQIGRAEPEDLEQMGGFKFSNGYWVRGEREQEVLLKMRTTDYQKIQQAKAEANIRMMKQPGAAKRDVVEAAGKQLGDQAAEFLRDVQIVGSVKDSKEIVEFDPQVE